MRYGVMRDEAARELPSIQRNKALTRSDEKPMCRICATFKMPTWESTMPRSICAKMRDTIPVSSALNLPSARHIFTANQIPQPKINHEKLR